MALKIRRSYRLLALWLALWLLAGCGTPATSRQAALRQEASEAEENLPLLTIGVNTMAPFLYVAQDGSMAGLDAEIAREACQRAGFAPVFVELPWARRDGYLESGSVDCLWTGCAIDGREDKYLWTDCYLVSPLAVITNRNSPLSSLEEYTGPGGVAVRAGSVSERTVLNIAGVDKVRAYGTYAMAETSFVKGYTDVLCSHRVVLKVLTDQYPGEYRYVTDYLTTAHLGVAFSPENGQEKRDAINQALASMKADGTLTALAKEYGLTTEGGDGNDGP